jgi:hypothetical protein
MVCNGEFLMKNIKYILLTLGIISSFGLATLPVATDAMNIIECGGQTGVICDSKDEKIEPKIKIIVDSLLFILGALSVIMIVISGIKYTSSMGDSSAITSAKNTLLYSVIGLVVAIAAYAIVNFVLTQFK